MPALSSPIPAAETTDMFASLIADLRRLCGWSDFARSVADQYERRGYLSANQLGAAQRMVAKAKADELNAARPAAPAVTFEQTTPLENIMAMFRAARRSGLSRPKIRFTDANGLPIVLTLAGITSRHPGAVYVTDGRPYGANSYFGRIDPNGILVPGRDVNEAVLTALAEIERNPSAAAAAYGRRTGCCCFCSRTLTAEDSVSVGYGPICAANHGLPHGSN
jgi:hypothetical protein